MLRFPFYRWGNRIWEGSKLLPWFHPLNDRIRIQAQILSKCVFSHLAPLSMILFRQEYWSGLSFPSPGDLPDPGIKPTFLASPELAGRFFTTSSTQGARFSPTESESEVAQSCPTLCNPVDCSLPRSSIHGIFQAKVLEWVAISFSRFSPKPVLIV